MKAVTEFSSRCSNQTYCRRWRTGPARCISRYYFAIFNYAAWNDPFLFFFFFVERREQPESGRKGVLYRAECRERKREREGGREGGGVSRSFHKSVPRKGSRSLAAKSTPCFFSVSCFYFLPKLGRNFSLKASINPTRYHPSLSSPSLSQPAPPLRIPTRSLTSDVLIYA